MSSNGHAGAPKKHLFILLNGKKCGNMELRSAVMDLRKEGHTIDVRVIYEKTDTERYVGEFLGLKPGTILVAAGGDGSINEVANSLLRHEAPDSTQVALIPLGTANDLCTGLEIPTDPREALEVALGSNDGYPIDLGMVNDQAFVNVATGGFGTELTVKTDENLKKSMGGAAYVLTGITSFSDITSKAATVQARSISDSAQLSERSYEILSKDSAEWPKDERGATLQPVAPDSRASFEGDLLILAVGNGRQAGGGLELCPDAVFSDGLLDLTYIMDPASKDLDIPKLLRFMTDPRGPGGAREILREEVNCYGTLRCKEVEVTCESGLQINCDGEPLRDTHFSFSILPRRLRLHVPHPQLLSQPRPERQRLSQLWEQQSSPRSPTQLAEPSHLATAGQSYCGARYACSLSAVSSPSAVYASPPRQPAGEVLIELADVHKRFGSKRVLQGCNIQIRRGEAVGIIGGSGSGKSTTLRLMAGLMAPDWGDVNIKGQKREGVLGDDPELGKLLQVGMVFQHSALFDSLTVGDNVGFLLREHSSLAPERIRELVAASLDAVGLHGVEHLYPSELSGGMQKRVALARAIIRDTDNPGPEQVIMYDEPTAGLDPVASTVVEDLIRSLQVARAAGQRSAAEVAGVASYIVVTHQHSTIRRAVDRLVFLHQGKVVWQGKTDDFDTTAEPIVAQFRSGHLDGPIRYD